MQQKRSDAMNSQPSSSDSDFDPRYLGEDGNVGKIDPAELPLIQEMRKLLRIRHYSRRTELAYVGWVQRFLETIKPKTADESSEFEVREFLSDLAVQGQVAASTQNQALVRCCFYSAMCSSEKSSFLTPSGPSGPNESQW